MPKKGKGDGSVSEVLASQARRSVFGSAAPTLKKTVNDIPTNPGLRGLRKMEPRVLLA